jgi:hypothetical protein
VGLFFEEKVGGNASLKCVGATKDVSMVKAKMVGLMDFS